MPFGRNQLALGVLIAALATAGCKEVRARRQIQEGNKAYYAGDYEDAIVQYDKGLAAAPGLAIGWYNLGLAHIAMFAPGKKTPENEAHAQGAIKAFSEYLRLNPKDTQARDYLLSTYIDSGHYEGALQYFEDRLAANPKDLEALGQLAQINSQAGKFDEAVKWHKKKAEVDPSTDGRADAWYSIGVLEWRRLNNHADVQGEGRLKIADEGIAALAQADTIRKDHAPTLSYQNLLYRERALAHGASWARSIDTATAQIYYKRAVELNKAAQAAQAQQPAGKPGAPAPKKK
jgi:tetratricopeptide (TPR) repeat protein